MRRETLQDEILKNVEFGSKLYAGSAVAYHYIGKMFVHGVVSHVKDYVRGQVPTNGVETFWSRFNRNLGGTYVAVEPFH